MQLHMLVIRPGAIGDALLSFPVLKALREHYTGAHSTFVSNAQVLPLALAFGVADEVGDYQDVQWSELFSSNGTRALQELLQQIELAICWLRDPGGVVERNLRMAGIKQLIIVPGRPPEGVRVHIVEYLAQTVGVPIKCSILRAGLTPWPPLHQKWRGGQGQERYGVSLQRPTSSTQLPTRLHKCHSTLDHPTGQLILHLVLIPFSQK